MKTRFWALGMAVMMAACEGGGSDYEAWPTQAVADDGEGELAFAGLALEAENGGLSMEDELPAFGDWEEIDPAAFADDAAAGVDAVEVADPEQEPELLDGKVAAYSLLAVWGHKNFTQGGDPVDWSGSFSVSKGVVKAAKVIAFDPADALVKDGDLRAVTFVSHTLPHHDGLLLRVLVPKAALAGKPMLTIDAGPVQMALSVESLDGLQEVVTVDDQGNRMVLVGAKHGLDAGCPKGLLGGYWKRLSPKGGVFGGKWGSMGGEAHGKVIGIWGTRKSGERAFFGLYAGKDGKRGLLAGHWQPFPEEGKGGTLVGHWIGKGGAIEGGLKGVYGGGEAEGDGKGSFQAVWKAACGQKGECKKDGAACAPTPAPECQCDPAAADLCICADDTAVE